MTRIAIVTLLAVAAVAADTPPLALVPLPAAVTPKTGTFSLTASTVIVTDASLAAIGHQLAAMLGPATGFDLEVRVGKSPGAGFIALREQPTLSTPLGSEGYQLEATPKGITIRGAAPAGVFYGVQTLRQLLPPAIFRQARVDGAAWDLPAVTIADTPRFSWRGSHLDVSRHFMPKEFVKKYIELLAQHKMNRFHWHLTDDQGWRIEIKKYPKLTDVGGWRPETLVGHESNDVSKMQFDGKRYGGFYTQDDIREIVQFAADRFITVIPEIEMPGHSQEVVAAYPELGSLPPAAPGTDAEVVQPRTHWGVSPYLLNPDDQTVKFMQDVLTEVMALFPSPWIHVGGDEAVKTQWKANPEIEAKIETLGLKNEDELQSWFIRQMDSFLTSHGRRLIGWDEILQGGLAENATVMSWQGTNGAIAAARSGHDAVLADSGFTYLDHYQSRDTKNEPLAIGGFLPLERVYGWEPMPAALEPEFQKHILGLQGQLWTEYLPDPKAVEYMAFPRISALAEAGWTPGDRRNFDDFRSRLIVELDRLGIQDVNYRRLDPAAARH